MKNDHGQDIIRLGDITDHGGKVAGPFITGRGDVPGSDAVFGLIGSPACVDGGAWRAETEGEAASTDDIIDTLYRQYCQVLADPNAPLPGNRDEWVAPTQAGSADISAAPASDQWDAGAAMESIEELLCGARSIDHAFGPLYSIQDFELSLDTGPVPEILRLFAPAEFRAAAAYRPADRPPELARREHHSMSIDSPLSMPFSILHDRYGDAS